MISDCNEYEGGFTMIANGFGRILNTTSGIRLEPQQSGYSASKAALDKITIDLGSTVEGTDVMINLTVRINKKSQRDLQTLWLL